MTLEGGELPGDVVRMGGRIHGGLRMSSTPKVSCPVHHLEFIVGSTIYINGAPPRRHLRCPIEGCTAISGRYCGKCRDLIRTERQPEHDRDTHDGKAIFTAYICPICGHNAFEFELKPGVGGMVT